MPSFSMTSLIHLYPSVKRSSPKKWADVSSMILVDKQAITFLNVFNITALSLRQNIDYINSNISPVDIFFEFNIFSAILPVQ